MTGSPKCNDGVLINRPCDGKQGEGHVTTKAEVRMMFLQDQEPHSLLAIPRG